MTTAELVRRDTQGTTDSIAAIDAVLADRDERRPVLTDQELILVLVEQKMRRGPMPSAATTCRRSRRRPPPSGA